MNLNFLFKNEKVISNIFLKGDYLLKIYFEKISRFFFKIEVFFE